ncbi:hypothetical protein ACQJBY_050376 [Aegilops geniculata]
MDGVHATTCEGVQAGSSGNLHDPGYPHHATCASALFATGRPRHTMCLRLTPPRYILCHNHPMFPSWAASLGTGTMCMVEPLGGHGTISIGEVSNAGTTCGVGRAVVPVANKPNGVA